MKLAQLYKNLRPELARIESQLKLSIASEQPDIKKASMHLLNAGGKRIRPVFVMLSGRFGDVRRSDILNVAVALELIHMASLVHDDVVDNSNLRRGRPTIKAKWDNRVAMYTGDYLFAGALKKMANIQQPAIHRTLSLAMKEMSVGEIIQIRELANPQMSLRHYLRRIKRKTALLIAVSCMLGARASGADEWVAKTLYTFGYGVGMSFQIMDDVLDFTGSQAQLGKPAGSDLRQGNMTAPTIYAMQHPGIREDIIAFLQKDTVDEAVFAHLLDKIGQSGGISHAQHLSAKYLQKAYGALFSLPDCEARRSLYEIAKYMGERRS